MRFQVGQTVRVCGIYGEVVGQIDPRFGGEVLVLFEDDSEGWVDLSEVQIESDATEAA